MATDGPQRPDRPPEAGQQPAGAQAPMPPPTEQPAGAPGPDGIAVPGPACASWGRRFAAAILDGLVYLGLSIVLFGVAFGLILAPRRTWPRAAPTC